MKTAESWLTITEVMNLICGTLSDPTCGADTKMGYLMSGAFATALLSVLLLYSGIITLEASIQEDTSSNEVLTFICTHVLCE